MREVLPNQWLSKDWLVDSVEVRGRKVIVDLHRVFSIHYDQRISYKFRTAQEALEWVTTLTWRQ